jgi:hypothetical protein
MPLSPDKATLVTTTACSVNNWVRKTSRTNYLTRGCIDFENINAREIISGAWHAHVSYERLGINLGSNHPSTLALKNMMIVPIILLGLYLLLGTTG